MDYIKQGGRIINALIEEAKKSGRREIVITRNYEIESTIRLPSDTALILESCELRMADNTFCQMFTNENIEKENITDRNISIIGKGSSVLDGGSYNGLSEKNCGKDGRPFIIVNNILTFCGVDGLTVSGLTVKNMRWWALNFIACSHGHIHDICFESDATYIDKETGERKFGLAGRDYSEIYIKNSDGIDLRLGCHDFLIENISGFTEDDTVALTALNGNIENYYPFPADAEISIHDVKIKNIRASAKCGLLRLLNQGGTELYNIIVDGVYDTSAGDPRVGRADRGVIIGDRHLYGPTYPTEDETRNITVRNVRSRAKSALIICGKVKNLITENIICFDGCENKTEYLTPADE